MNKQSIPFKILGNQGFYKIDIDSEASKREEIMELSRKRYGKDRVLNCCTFTTEGPNQQ